MKSSTLGKTVPTALRWSVYFLSTLLTFLWIWLLGFLLADIGDLKGPDFEAIRRTHVDQTLLDKSEAVNRQSQDIQTQIDRQKEIQRNLKNGMDNARGTMQQMMDLHRLSLERQVTPSNAEQEALATSQKRFLDAQDRFEQANNEIAVSTQKTFELNQELKALNEQIDAQRVPAIEEYQKASRKHHFRVASFQLAFIVPLFVLAAWLVHKRRSSPFQPVYFSLLIAAFWKVGTVMFQHFPREFFKYIAILSAIVIVLSFLVWMLRRSSKPSRELLLKRFREAYARHQCPVCAYPIARGALKQALWTRKGPIPLVQARHQDGTVDDTESAYACPACGTSLFAPCESCANQCPTLLPFCDSCGREHAVAYFAEAES